MTDVNPYGLLYALAVCYGLIGVMVGNITAYRIRLPYRTGADHRGRDVFRTTPEQEKVIKTRGFWAGVFWPLVATVWVLGWALYGLFKLVTVPFRRLEPKSKIDKRTFYGHADSLDGPRATIPADEYADYARNVVGLSHSGMSPLPVKQSEVDTAEARARETMKKLGYDE